VTSRRGLPALLVVGVLLASCGTTAPSAGNPAGARATSADAWADATLRSLGIEQKAAQMVFVRAEPGVVNPDAETYRALLEQIRELGVGGVVLFRTPRDTIPLLVNDLQDAAAIPLLVAADVERSVAFRVPDGSADLPWAMAIGATRSTGRRASPAS
jgi:hypothetical protein